MERCWVEKTELFSQVSAPENVLRVLVSERNDDMHAFFFCQIPPANPVSPGSRVDNGEVKFSQVISPSYVQQNLLI